MFPAVPNPGGERIPAGPARSRQDEVLTVISQVRDPEIDETVAALDFLVGVDIAEDVVTVSLRLPTFWCPANFVFLMAQDMRQSVMALDWVRDFRLRLVDHFAEDEINRGINEGHSFKEVFPQASRDLDELRRDFDEKAFLMRQGALLERLREEGLDREFLARASIGEIEAVCARGDAGLAGLWTAYLEKRVTIGLGSEASGRVAVDAGGRSVDDLIAHQRAIRGITTNASANGEMCRMLVAARREGGGCGLAHAHQHRQ